MSFRESQSSSRARYLENYDDHGAAEYDRWVTALTSADHDACIEDLSRAVQFTPGMSVLDSGAGTGALTLTLNRIGGLQITALEPSVSMGNLLSVKPGLSDIPIVNEFCDHPNDRAVFPPGTFDLITSRLLVNCLYDPIVAFQNWNAWLRPGGSVVVIDGFFGRNAWTGPWATAIDSLPLSACQSMACIPYLLELAGFRCSSACLMESSNQRPSTRTQRFLVVAHKGDESTDSR